METSQPCNALAADDDYPRWVMFIQNESHWKLQADPCPINADAKTVAHARTSTGHPFRASIRLAPPPAVSHLNVNFDGGSPDGLKIHCSVVEVHGDSVLVVVRTSMENTQEYRYRYRGRTRTTETEDYFIYSSGNGTDRLPSLSLLPPCYIDGKSANVLPMEQNGTGILRLADGELVVTTNLKMKLIACDDDGGTKRAEAELRLLRSSELQLQWKVERLPVRQDASKGEVSFDQWRTDRVIAVADRFLYWVDLHEGIVFSDVCGESPELKFVPLPLDPLRRTRSEYGPPDFSRNLCATDGGAAVKFVLVCPRCCCGGPGVTSCAVSCHAFTVTTWTLRSTQGGGMEWEKDGVVDSGELWALDAYRCVPRLPMDLPVVSIKDPDVICFFVSEHWHTRRRSGESKTTWVVMIDMRTKSLVGSRPIITSGRQGLSHYFAETFLPSQVSSYFNTSPGSRNNTPPASQRRRHKDIGVPRAVETDCVASPDQEVLAALQEIPGLTRDEMLRAYGVLACDDRRRYRSLVALPMDMRKDYCCMLVDMGNNTQMQ